MIFNSFPFALFLPVVLILYWASSRLPLRFQNFLVLFASYVFYGWWDYRFLILIFFSSIVDYLIGLKLGVSTDKKIRKALLITSLSTNLGLLGFFKYFNFFADSFANLVRPMGLDPGFVTLNIILPVGISFYTFQTLSYTIDIYRKQLEPTKDVIAFFAFVSFFPQLVAGPIERARNLLPQFHKKREFDIDKARDGLRQMLWGFFKKVVIADNISMKIDFVFDNIHSVDSFSLIIALILFNIQVYCDFSGYSDIAIGTARLFGFNLMQNFAFPIFSRNITEYWRRWHISLSTWFRDYLYFPLGGSHVSDKRKIFNIITTFTVSGLWHGASWHFVIWGFLNGCAFIPNMLSKNRQKFTNVIAEGRIFPSLTEIRQVFLTFLMIQIPLVFLRAQTLGDAFSYLGGIVMFKTHSLGTVYNLQNIFYFFTAAAILFEWFMRDKKHGLEIAHWPRAVRWITYLVIIFVFMIFGAFEQKEFFYFQF